MAFAMGITPDCEDWATMTFVRAEVGIPRKEWYCHCSTSTGRREGFGDRFLHQKSHAVSGGETGRKGEGRVRPHDRRRVSGATGRGATGDVDSGSEPPDCGCEN